MYKPGKLFFQCMVYAAVTGNQVRRPAAGAKFIQALMKSGNNVRVICQPKVIITAECQVLLAINPDLDTLRTINNLPGTVQTLLLALAKFSGEVFHSFSGSIVLYQM